MKFCKEPVQFFYISRSFLKVVEVALLLMVQQTVLAKRPKDGKQTVETAGGPIKQR